MIYQEYALCSIQSSWRESKLVVPIEESSGIWIWICSSYMYANSTLEHLSPGASFSTLWICYFMYWIHLFMKQFNRYSVCDEFLPHQLIFLMVTVVIYIPSTLVGVVDPAKFWTNNLKFENLASQLAFYVISKLVLLIISYYCMKYFDVVIATKLCLINI